MRDPKEAIECSFCSWYPDGTEDDKFILAGPGVYICSDCVDIACEIVLERRAGTPQERVRRFNEKLKALQTEQLKVDHGIY